ncbi:MAG TPA: 2-succinyl-5-enolpyruvyl-6-hydroxy-3-cyclohexene-1-carboxylic-acid synthase [Nocardioidaceae bacterium]|nr:2-succinyl-5-enolpyruvyl-6-hydroxy-3-cyclohexene-1-carboxylic-acid synthase [Nocardioidaceae bacterium]
MTNASTLVARTLVDELIRLGVRDAVVAPGSRSAPLAMALHAAAAGDRLRLHVRVDERSAGFTALGLAKARRRPVPVVTTSGTAVANLHPAVLEADHAGVPLLVLSADRPATLRGTGANQTTTQVHLFGRAVRLFADLPASPTDGPGIRTLAARAVAAATGARTRTPGPVQINCQFVEPLMPDPGDDAWPVGRTDGRPWTDVDRLPASGPVELPVGPRTVVVAGDDAGPPARMLAERAGWPLLAEPSSGARTGTHPIGAYRLLLDHPELGGRIERVVAFGHSTLSRPVTRLLGRDDVELIVVDPSGRWNDPGHRAARVVQAATVGGSAADTGEGEADDWLAAWRVADAVAAEAIAKELASEPVLTPYETARVVSESVPREGLLVVGSSHPIRDLDLMAVAHPVGERRRVVANRGLAGIDGTLSTAIGAAVARRSSRALAYVGDLTFLHDANGLVLGPDEPRPDLTIVVADDGGGSIFSVIESGDPAYATGFERLFGTPTRTDIAALCAAHQVPCVRVADADALRAALARTPEGIEVVAVTLDRANRRNLDHRLRVAVESALARAR